MYGQQEVAKYPTNAVCGSSAPLMAKDPSIAEAAMRSMQVAEAVAAKLLDINARLNFEPTNGNKSDGSVPQMPIIGMIGRAADLNQRTLECLHDLERKLFG